MPWARVDDQWWSHPKVLDLTLEARGLWITALSWSCAQRRDEVPTGFVRMVALDEDDRLSVELANAGLWAPTERGWRIHDWAQYQDLSLSEKRADAGRKGAEKRWQTDGKPETETSPDQAEENTAPDGKPMANEVAMPLAMHDKSDGRSPSRPDRSQPPGSSDQTGERGTDLEVSSRSRNPYYDACAIAFDMPERGRHEGVFGRIAALCKTQGHPPDEILKRVALHIATFDFAPTPGSVHKRWDELGSRVVTATKAEKKRVQAELERMRRRDQITGGAA